MTMRLHAVAVVLLSFSVSAFCTFLREADYDVIDLDAEPVLNIETLRISLNSSRHQVNVDLEERELSDVPAFSINARGELEPLGSSETTQTYRLLRGNTSRAGFILTEDSDGSSQLHGFAADADGQVVIQPAPAHVRQQRDAGNWHVVYRRQAGSQTTVSDALSPGDELQKQWEDAMKTKLGPKTRTGAVDKWVEVLTVSDYELYERFKTWVGASDQGKVVEFMKLYFSLLVGDVDDMHKASFKTDPDLRINIRLVGMVINTEPGKCPFVEGASVQVSGFPTDSMGRKTYDDIGGLAAFASWLQSFKAPVQYDVGVHLTGRDMRLTDGGDGAVGRGYLAGICSFYQAVSVEVFGDWEESHILVHEIGHNLGSSHDGEAGNPEAIKCPTQDNFIMTSEYPSINAANHIVFSPCSKVQIKKTLAMSRKECINNMASHQPSSADKIAKYTPGLLYTFGELCKNRHGPKATSFNYDELTQGQLSVCSTLACHTSTPEWGQVWPMADIIAPKGTPCGDGKWCVDTACVADPLAPKGECFLGDTVFETYDSTLRNWRMLPCTDAITYLQRTKGYSTVAAICNAEPKFKTNCCRTCGVPGGITTALRDSIIGSQPQTQSPTTPAATTSTAAAWTTTTRGVPTQNTTFSTHFAGTTVSSCRDDPAAGALCKTSMIISMCNNEFVTMSKNGVNLGPVPVVCKASCGKC